MALDFITEEDSKCTLHSKSSPERSHAAQLHFNLSSLPSPNTPISIPSFPIEINSESAVFRPRIIANLWTQLLSIQIQNGNFWRHNHAVKLYKETPGPSPAEEQERKLEKLEKTVLFIRYKIQKGLLNRERSPVEADLPEIALLFEKLVGLNLDVRVIRKTNIHKVCRAVMNLENIPGSNNYHLKAQAASLHEFYQTIIDEHRENWEASSPRLAPENLDPDISAVSPALCLSQLTPEQCSRIEEAARLCDPPLDRGVVELMCMLPQMLTKYEDQDSGLAMEPRAKLTHHPYKWSADGIPQINRGAYRGGPTIPPQMLQLTDCISNGDTVALYVDTRTGEGFHLRDYSPMDPGTRCTEFEGDRKPIEEVLQGLINDYIALRIVPIGYDQVMWEKYKNMFILKQRFLLEEYGWPSTFPLKPAEQAALIRRQSEIAECQNNHRSLEHQWDDLTYEWHEGMKSERFHNSDDVQDIEMLRALDKKIGEALKFHENKAEDREYSLAADVPFNPSYHGQPLILRNSTHECKGLKFDITPDGLIGRFKEVIHDQHGHGWKPEWKQMKEIMDGAYERYKLTGQGIHVPDYIEGEDNDETMDYEQSESECDDEEEWEEDEEDEDLDFDVAMLEEDVKLDVGDLRKQMEGFEMSGV